VFGARRTDWGRGRVQGWRIRLPLAMLMRDEEPGM
jgi:hypothetical protein